MAEERMSSTRATLAEQHAAPRGAAHIHLIVGPVGSGKSTFALRLPAALPSTDIAQAG